MTYVLELLPHERQPRCLTSISSMGIAFNVSGYREFSSLKEVEEFKERWKNHFFKLETLRVIEKPSKSG